MLFLPTSCSAAQSRIKSSGPSIKIFTARCLVSTRRTKEWIFSLTLLLYLAGPRVGQWVDVSVQCLLMDHAAWFGLVITVGSSLQLLALPGAEAAL